jgi:DNA-binding HxlR family transcriptional regulator
MPNSRDPILKTACTSRLILDQIADKWSVLILAVLCAEPRRFNAIKRSLDGITQKALTQALRRLERNGLVARRVIPISPVAVEYSVTPLGRTLQQPFAALNVWAVDHLPEVQQAQQAFDRRAND